MAKGLIFDIKRYAINDGPGIRLTIFFKGCPLSCTWCHNPESLSPDVQKLYIAQRCMGAQACIEVCPNQALKLTPQGIVTDVSACQLCGLCAQACPTKAIELSGERMDVAALMQTIERESFFFDQSEGGVTFSGGEPLLHHHHLLELLKQCGKLHIHRVVDTSLFASWKIVQEVAKETELFLIDLKHMSDEKHLNYTGVSNKLILQNIEKLAHDEVDFIIRIPLIDGVNADIHNLEATAQFLVQLPWQRREVNLLPYHDIAKNKHLKLGTTYDGSNMNEPSQTIIERAINIFANHDIRATVGG
jgi:pyruvate formate lyase activating enzyme